MNDAFGIGFPHEIAFETALAQRRASAIPVAAGAVHRGVALARGLHLWFCAGRLGPDVDRLVGRDAGARC